MKIYEIQNIVEHELLNANEYAGQGLYRIEPSDFDRSQAADSNFLLTNCSIRSNSGQRECQQAACFFNTQRSLTANCW